MHIDAVDGVHGQGPADTLQQAQNVLFAASKDGQFRVWKIPHEWRSKVIDEREMNAEYERR